MINTGLCHIQQSFMQINNTYFGNPLIMGNHVQEKKSWK